jgi:hypothetical protein
MHYNTGRIKTNLSGQVFGRLSVLHIDYDKVGQIRGSQYLCKCECGSIVSKSRHSLIRKINAVKSCGCLQKESARNAALPNAGANKNYWIRKYKKRAKAQGVEFTLTDKTFFELCSQNCFYCNDPPIPRGRISKSTKDGIFLANGLDRIKPKKGYTLDNVVTCCTDCNLRKRDSSQADFIEKCIKIAKLHNKETKQ